MHFLFTMKIYGKSNLSNNINAHKNLKILPSFQLQISSDYLFPVERKFQQKF